MPSTPIAFVPAALLTTLNIGRRAFVADPHAHLYERILQAVDFAPRDALEEDPSRKQIIPYVVFERGEEIWTMIRIKGSSERRLHHKASVGVGGHVEREAPGLDTIRAAMEREVMEELVMEHTHLDLIEYIGVLHDATTPVGAVHMGLVFRARLPHGTSVAINETDKLLGMWCPRAGIHDATHEGAPLAFESWSTIALEHLYPRA